MTGYTVHTGSTVKFCTGWDQIFGSTQGTAKSAKKAGSQAKASRAAKKRTKPKAPRKTR